MHYLEVCEGYDVARESRRYLHATTRILLSRFTSCAHVQDALHNWGRRD